MIAKIEAPALSKVTRFDAKAHATNVAARAIIEAEAAQRNAKTMRLKKARLKAEAESPMVSAVRKVRQARRR